MSKSTALIYKAINMASQAVGAFNTFTVKYSNVQKRAVSSDWTIIAIPGKL